MGQYWHRSPPVPISLSKAYRECTVETHGGWLKFLLWQLPATSAAHLLQAAFRLAGFGGFGLPAALAILLQGGTAGGRRCARDTRGQGHGGGPRQHGRLHGQRSWHVRRHVRAAPGHAPLHCPCATMLACSPKIIATFARSLRPESARCTGPWPLQCGEIVCRMAGTFWVTLTYM